MTHPGLITYQSIQVRRYRKLNLLNGLQAGYGLKRISVFPDLKQFNLHVTSSSTQTAKADQSTVMKNKHLTTETMTSCFYSPWLLVFFYVRFNLLLRSFVCSLLKLSVKKHCPYTVCHNFSSLCVLTFLQQFLIWQTGKNLARLSFVSDESISWFETKVKQIQQPWYCRHPRGMVTVT